MYRYEIFIFWNEEDQAYIAEISELPGCLAQGDTAEKALENAQEAIELWLATAVEIGDAIPEPNGRRLMYA